MTDRIQLGQTYRDEITGFQGVATTRSEHLTGCASVRLLGEGKSPSEEAATQWCEEPYLVHVPDGRSVPTWQELEDQRRATLDAVASAPTTAMGGG